MGSSGRDALEGGERHLLHKMNRYLEVNLSDPYGVVLSSPRSPARAAIRSKYLLDQSGVDGRAYFAPFVGRVC